jgi:hypothetical protein
MRKLIIVLAILALAVGASARQAVYEPRDIPETDRLWGWCFFDDLESGAPGWSHGDGTATAVPHFHVDTYLAYSGTYSWWCGNFDYDADGGYGNSWDDRLDIPTTPWPAGSYEVITFAYRNDTEPLYDYSYVDAESSGAYVHLNRGFDGVHPWGVTGYYLGNKDNPTVARFRFVSDGAWSDADGLYLSVGGAFMCDEIHIWDYNTGTTHFFDDVESGGLCTPSVPAAAGDYWHLVEDECLAFSDPTVWVNTEQPEENFVPPGVQNWLRSPTACIEEAYACTTYFIIQFFTPTVDNDYWTETVYIDGEGTQLHAWWGDQCDAGYDECDHFLGGDDVTPYLMPGSAELYHEWVYYTTDNGAGPDICNHAGITIDDYGVYGVDCPCQNPVEETSWGKVKSMYR